MQECDSLRDHAAAVQSHKQPRHTRGPLLLQDFKTKVHVQVPLDMDLPPKIPDSAPHPLQGLPLGSKLLSSLLRGDSQRGDKATPEAVFGVYRTPGEFFRIASEIRHPFDTPLPIEDANLKAIQALVEKGPHFVAHFRVEQLKKNMALARNLEPKERLLKESMHPDVRQVMQSKRLLLFGKMLKDAGVQDERLLQDMVDGFRLVGQQPPSGQFPLSFKTCRN